MTRLHTLTLATLVALMIVPSGCFVRYDIQKTTQGFKVTTSPPNSFVWEQDKEGKRAVGKAPATLEIPYQRKIGRKNWWSIGIQTLLSTAAVAGSIALLANSGLSGDSDGAGLAGLLGTAVLGPWALASWAAVVMPDGHDATAVRSLTIGASRPGYADAWTKVSVPNKKAKKKIIDLHLELTPGGGAAPAASAPASSPSRPSDRPIVAVFALEDASGRLSAKIAEELAEFLAIQITATGKFRTIPRAQLRKKLSTAKKEGYKDCYEQSCQIELGKALAAQKSLSTKLLTVGKVCTITSVLFDLKTETSEGAATVQTGCSTAKLLEGLQAVAAKLGKSR